MKKLNLVSLFLFFILIASVFTINVSADDIDYNNTIIINNGSTYITFSNYGLVNSTWETYIDYLRTKGIINFTILDDYVLFEGDFLLNKSGDVVKSSDKIIPAAGCLYTLRQIYNYNGTGYYFDEILNNTTFYKLVKAYEEMNINVFSLHGYYSNYYLYYNGYPFILNDDHVKGSNYITSGIYTTDTDFVCTHDYLIIKTIENASCISTGSHILECGRCGNQKEEVIPIDTNAHQYYVSSSLPATCTQNGAYILCCSLCNSKKTDIINKLDHKFEGATCTSPSKCIYCGEEGESLGHNKNIIGYCKRCDTFPKDDEPTFDFGEWWSGIEEWSSDAGQDIDNFFIKITNSIKATAIVCCIFAVLVFVYYSLSFVNNVNAFKDRWKQKRNNRQNKGNKRK